MSSPDAAKADEFPIPSQDELEDLQVAFDRWRYGHGVIWFDTDRELAETISAVLSVNLKWDDDE